MLETLEVSFEGSDVTNKMDDNDEIPIIDAPAFPEPDFFDADDGMLPFSSQALNSAVTQPVAPSSVLDCVADSSLKYDDELCEFNEFLVGVEETVIKTPSKEKDEEAKVLSKQIPENEDQSPEEAVMDQDDKEKMSEDVANVDSENKCRAVASSGPNTPESRTGSAVIRITMPKVCIPTKSSSVSKDKPLESPSRTLRGRVGGSSSNNSESRTKRKLSDDEEYDPEDDDDEEIKIEPRSSRFNNRRKNGRETRRSTRTRYGEDDDEVEEDHCNRPKRSTAGRARQVRKVARYGFEDDDGSSSDAGKAASSDSDAHFEVGKKKGRGRSRSNYWTGSDGVIHFDSGEGNIILIKPVSVRLIRLSEVDINKEMEKENNGVDDIDNPFLLEVCIDNIRSAGEAVKGGAKRIELCSALSEGGLTPTGGFLTLVKESFKDIPVFVMIRPRGGDFVYSREEVEIMIRDISYYKQMGADGFVFGALTKDCEVDVASCKLLKEAAFPLECTFHRAFDKVSDPLPALEKIISIGFTRILTSGLAATAQTGIRMIKQLVDTAGSRITIMAGAGVNQHNVGDIISRTGVTEVHGSASKAVQSNMCPPGPSKSHKRGGGSGSKPGVKMGSVDDSVMKVTDSHIVWQIVKRGRAQVKRFK